MPRTTTNIINRYTWRKPYPIYQMSGIIGKSKTRGESDVVVDFGFNRCCCDGLTTIFAMIGIKK